MTKQQSNKLAKRINGMVLLIDAVYVAIVFALDGEQWRFLRTFFLEVWFPVSIVLMAAAGFFSWRSQKEELTRGQIIGLVLAFVWIALGFVLLYLFPNFFSFSPVFLLYVVAIPVLLLLIWWLWTSDKW